MLSIHEQNLLPYFCFVLFSLFDTVWVPCFPLRKNNWGWILHRNMLMWNCFILIALLSGNRNNHFRWIWGNFYGERKYKNCKPNIVDGDLKTAENVFWEFLSWFIDVEYLVSHFSFFVFFNSFSLFV